MNKGKSKKRLQFKHILSIITLVLVGLIIYGAREDFAGAIGYLGDMNIWILLLLIPMQVLMYFAAGKVYFTYLQAKKEGMKISLWKLMRISFEINFANQILPSGGASGIAYIAWRLRSYGITPGQTTMMQIFRYAAVSAATVFQMLVALVVLGITGALSGWIFWISVAITSGLMVGVVVLLLIISRKKRVDWFVQIVSRFINFVIGRLLFWKKERLVLIKPAKLDGFLTDLHKEYDDVRKNPRLLVRPFLWGTAYAFIDAMTFVVAFLALGIVPNVWAIILAQGVASVVGTIAITPGGAGFYEVVMMTYFVAAGSTLEVGFVVTVVTRVIVLLGTILLGWGFYQQALMKAGKGRPGKALGGEEDGSKAQRSATR